MVCVVCYYRGFSTETERDVHLRCHVNNSITYKCCFCEYSPNVSINWYPLKEHIIAKHPGHIPPEFECGICSKCDMILFYCLNSVRLHTGGGEFEVTSDTDRKSLVWLLM